VGVPNHYNNNTARGNFRASFADPLMWTSDSSNWPRHLANICIMSTSSHSMVPSEPTLTSHPRHPHRCHDLSPLPTISQCFMPPPLIYTAATHLPITEPRQLYRCISVHIYPPSTILRDRPVASSHAADSSTIRRRHTERRRFRTPGTWADLLARRRTTRHGLGAPGTWADLPLGKQKSQGCYMLRPSAKQASPQ